MCGFSEDAKPERLPARIVVAKVVGDVNATNQADKTTRSLKQNDVIFEKYTVNVGSESSAVLIFANTTGLSTAADLFNMFLSPRMARHAYSQHLFLS